MSCCLTFDNIYQFVLAKARMYESLKENRAVYVLQENIALVYYLLLIYFQMKMYDCIPDKAQGK